MQAKILRSATLPLIAASAFSALSFTGRSLAAESKSATTRHTSNANDLYEKTDALAPLKKELNQKLKPNIVLGAIQCSLGEGYELYIINTNNPNKPISIWDPKNKSFRDDISLAPSDVEIDAEDKKLGSFAFDFNFQLDNGKNFTLRVARHHNLNMQIYTPGAEANVNAAGSAAIDFFQLRQTTNGKIEKIKSEDSINGVKIIGGVSHLPSGISLSVPDFLSHRSSQVETALIIKTPLSSILVDQKYTAIHIKDNYESIISGRSSPDTEIRLYIKAPKDDIEAPDIILYLKDGHLVPGYKSLIDSLRDLREEYSRRKK